MVNASRFPCGVCDRGKLRKLLGSLGFMSEKDEKGLLSTILVKQCGS